MQISNTADLRGDAVGVCDLQPVVPCSLCLAMQGAAPQGDYPLGSLVLLLDADTTGEQQWPLAP